jgi:Arc/MetJ-type ribon-helix-helix transcriptional regulator
MTERTQINLVLSEQQKQKWKDNVADNASQYQSLSHLVRVSVEKELSDDPQQEIQIPDELSEFGKHVQQLENELDEISTRLETVEAEVKDDPRIKELASEIFRRLPTSVEEIQADEHDLGNRYGSPSHEESATVASGRIEDLASRLDEPELQIREALRLLQEDTAQVYTETINGEERYLKEE